MYIRFFITSEEIQVADWRMEFSEFDPQIAAEFLRSIQSTKINFILRSTLHDISQLFIEANFVDCLKSCDIAIDYVWEKLNTGHWSDIADTWRHVYYVVSMYKALCQVKLVSRADDCVKSCDMGLLMGLRPHDWQYKLTDLASHICQQKINKQKPRSPQKGMILLVSKGLFLSSTTR